MFSAGRGDEDFLAAESARAIEKRSGFVVDVIVRGHVHLRTVAEACPFPAAELTARQLHGTYVYAPVTPGRLEGIDSAAHLPEEFRPEDRSLPLRPGRPGPLQARRVPAPPRG